MALSLVDSHTAHVVPCTVEHYLEAVRGGETWISARACAESHTRMGPAWAGYLGEDLLGCAGVVIPWAGMGEAWAVLTDAGRQHGRIVARQILRGFETIIREHRLRRVQADVLPEFGAAMAFVEWLGFTRESRMRRYAPDGRDMDRYILFPRSM